MVEPRERSLEGRQYVAQACAILADRNSELRSRVERAAHLFWKAFYFKETWPQVVASEAASMMAVVFRYGTIADTLRRMNADELRETAAFLDGFCRHFLAIKQDDRG